MTIETEIKTAAPSSASSLRVWSAYQLAVFADIESGKGHTFVGAVAGSGKSTTIVEGLNYVPQGCKSLFCTFGKDATDALAAKLKTAKVENVECSTLHSYGARQIGRGCGRYEVDKNKSYRIIADLFDNGMPSKEIQASLVKAVGFAKNTLAKTASDIEALVLEYGIEFQDQEASEENALSYEEELRRFVRGVVLILDRAAEMTEIIDFDDMIWLPIRLNLHCWQFDRVFIDEVQDLNACQIELALRACKSNGRILAVGDERQAIYAFRGADENAVKNLIERLRAKTLLLSVSYRCPKAVVREAQKYVPAIEYAPNAIEGNVSGMSFETMKNKVQPGDFILSRTNADLISLCLGFLAEGRRALVVGRDMGKNLSSLIKKSKCTDVRTFLIYLDGWQAREINHFADRTPPLEDQIHAVQDKAACLQALCEGAQSLNEVEARITALFADKPAKGDFDTTRIILSTTHKAKGLERKNVYLLRDTYLRTRKGQDETSMEEKNLYYVAVTRSQENLYIVREDRDGGR